MSTPMTTDPELLALIGLVRELAVRKVQVGMRDALPALAVNTAVPGVQFYVFANCSKECFTWLATGHPLNDPAGAAEEIALDARSWDSDGAVS